MPTYTLTISLTGAQVTALQTAGDKIMLAKPSSADGPPNVAWLALPPQQNTTVTWTDEYGLYFATQAFAAGAGIIAAADISVVESLPPPIARQVLYKLSVDGRFTGPDTSQGTAGAFALLSQYKNGATGAATTVGLTQCATVGGTPASTGALPILADAVLTGQTDTIAPSPSVYIWTQSPGGTATASAQVVAGGQTLLLFSDTTTTLAVVYNSGTGMFIISNNS